MKKSKKYEIDKDCFWKFNGRKLYAIRALRRIVTSYGYVIRPGELGGYIESEKNLSQEGECWINNTAKVFENARVTDNAYVGNQALAFGNAEICNNAKVVDNAIVFDNAKITENSFVHGTAIVCDNAVLYETAELSFGSVVSGNVKLNLNNFSKTIQSVSMHDFIANDTIPLPEDKQFDK